MQRPSGCWPFGSDLINKKLQVGTFRENWIYFSQVFQEALARHDAVGKKRDHTVAPTTNQNPRWFPNHSKVLVPNLRHQKSLSKELCKDAAIFWKILSAKRYIPLSKWACQGMNLVPAWVQNPVVSS